MLREDGFTDLAGVDPFTRDGDRRQEGFVIHRSLAEVDGRIDFVLMDDSFEHMPDPLAVLTDVRRICAPLAHVCISVPIKAEAWRTYGTDWVQLDAPRHLYLHTERSLETLARQAGFVVQAALFDSTAFQFWGSELYRRGIPLEDARARAVVADGGMFGRDQIREWQRMARRLNHERRGDHATFFLRPAA
jgi:SAM-dependent methyltransferase